MSDEIRKIGEVDVPIGDGKTVKVNVMPDEDIAKCSGALCAEKDPDSEAQKIFSDNLEGPCSGGCGRTLVWRPYLPASLPKYCISCLGEVI
jgi:hypothetical protein